MKMEPLTTQSFPVFRAIGEPRKGRLEKLLSIFADVRAGEGGTVVLLFLNGFLLMSSYYILKVIREAVILSRQGAEVESYSSAAQAAVLLFLIPLYGKFASRVNRVQLLTWVTLFFVSHAALFYIAGKHDIDIGVPYYIWLGVLNMLLVAQFWGFANDLYTESEGKRLFPVVGTGVAIGSVSGAYAASQLFKGRKLDAFEMMLLGSLILAATVPVMRAIHARESPRGARNKSASGVEPLGREGGFELVWRDRYLLLIATMVLLLNLVNTTGGYLLNKFIENEALRTFGAGDSAAAARQAFIGGFSGTIQFWQNLLVMIIQLFVVSRVFLYVGVRGALFILPALALGAYTLVATAPVLALLRAVKIAENATDYSLSNTARAALFLPTSREAKYKAKAAIDSFFARFGDMLQAGVVFIGLRLALGPSGFAAINVVLTCVWLVVVGLIGREHKRRLPVAVKAAAA